ncbi:MAG: polysulfide reductase NrfD [Spirochaetia bacterium]|nr:polysulfide reductase NrfD [Spirochaetia bacterium]
MIERALRGNKLYWGWVGLLLAAIGVGIINYMEQLKTGLTITGMSRDITWGFYIAQLTFFVGVAASAVMMVIPYYLHDYKKFGKTIIFGEFLAVASVTMCLLFVVADMGQPQRALFVMFYPRPNSILFWDFVVLNGYLFLNIIIGWVTLEAEKNQVAPPKWVKPLIYLSIPWAVSIHTVTAFLIAGLPGRHLWLTAIMAPRFLASAFAAGPALLIILLMIVKKFSKFDPGKEPIQTLGKIVTYAMITNLFFYGLEFFTAFYSNIPGHMHSLEYLFWGLHGDNGEVYNKLVPAMWTSMTLGILGIALIIKPSMRQKETVLLIGAVMIFAATWIDKGLGLIIGGFIPNPIGYVTEYTITTPELLISIGIWSIGILIVTLGFKMAASIKKEVG